jgi:endonuclease/exonuclease/phosphatase family metal-dependent hydrolase
VIIAADPDVVAVQEIGDEASFDALRVQLGAGRSGALSTHVETAYPIRVGWLSPGWLSDVEEITDLPAALVPVVKVGDDGTTTNQLGRGALAVTYTTSGGTVVRALSVYLKSKLLSFPGGRFDTNDEE